MDVNIYVGLSDKFRFLYKNKIKIADKDGIMAAVSESLDIPIETILSKDRHQDVAMARQIAMALIRKYEPSVTLKRIGRMFRRDHSTVIYALRTFDNLYGRDKTFTAQVDKVMMHTNYN
jgi:chromosomal replication initiator protein